MINYEQLMSEYTDIEFSAHIELDDVLNKVTQETWEIIEAKEVWNIEEMYKEASDTLVNIASVVYQLWITPDLDKKQNLEVTASKLLIDLGKWNTNIQWFRNRYSREEETVESVTNSTNNLVADILSFSDPDLSALDMIENNISKFISRAWWYYENIDLKDYVNNIPNFPKEWVDFKDISPLLKDRNAMKNMIFSMAEQCKSSDVIIGLDARGFIFGEAIANLLEKPFVMMRKAWKLPWKTIWSKYWLEYWNDEIEIQEWTITIWKKISIVDDLLATWWTIKSSIDLVEKVWWKVENVVFAISLNNEKFTSMKKRQELLVYNIESILNYD